MSASLQISGCLPDGFGMDSMLTVEQFAAWQQMELATVRKLLPTMAGVVKRSRKNIRIHPRTYLETSLNR